VAPGGGEAALEHGLLGRREGGGEACQRGGGGAAPAVDRLLRIADGARGVAGTEEVGEHLQLGHGGVLELVQQHHLVHAPGEGAGRRHLAGYAGGEGDLVGEVEGGGFGADLREALEQRDQGQAGLERAEHGGHGLRGGAAASLDLQRDAGEVGADLLEVLGQLGGGGQVVRERGGQREQRGGERRRGGLEVERVVPALDDLVGELPGGGGGHRGQLGGDPDGERMLAHQVQGEAVVGVDHGPLPHQVIAAALEPRRQREPLAAQGGGEGGQARGDP